MSENDKDKDKMRALDEANKVINGSNYDKNRLQFPLTLPIFFFVALALFGAVIMWVGR